MKRLAAKFLMWLTNWLPLPEAIEFGLSEWAYQQLHDRPILPTHHLRFGPQQIERE